MTVAPAPARSRLISHLRAEILKDFEPELVTALRYGVYAATGYRRSEIQRMMPTVTPVELRRAEDRVRKARNGWTGARMSCGELR